MNRCVHPIGILGCTRKVPWRPNAPYASPHNLSPIFSLPFGPFAQKLLYMPDGSMYTFRIAAVTEWGQGDWSEQSFMAIPGCTDKVLVLHALSCS